MSKVIYKYDVPIADKFTVAMPTNSKVLSVHMQYGAPKMWVQTHDAGDEEERSFHLIGTGNPMPDVGDFVGTFQMDRGALVWHLFEAIRQEV